MATLERRDVEQALSQKGFTLEAGDHRYYRLYVDGKKTAIATKVSRGSKPKTLPAPIVGAMARQLRITSKELQEFVECTLTRDGYMGILRERGENV